MKVRVRVDVDPPDVVRQMGLATAVAGFLADNFPMSINKITSDVITDEEWLG